MQTQQTRRTRIGKHLRRNVVAYLALMLAVSMSPLPSWAAGKIGTSDIKNGAVTAKKIKNNAVKSSKIKDGSVTKADLNAAALGFTSVRTERIESTGIGTSERSTRTVVCGDGEVAIGGGAYAVPTGVVLIGGSSGDLEVSIPAFPGAAPLFLAFPAGDNAEPTAWRTTLRNTEGDPTSVFHYAMCASK